MEHRIFAFTLTRQLAVQILLLRVCAPTSPTHSVAPCAYMTVPLLQFLITGCTPEALLFHPQYCMFACVLLLLQCSELLGLP